MALKAEEEAARIPIVLLTDDITQEGMHFHTGTDSPDNSEFCWTISANSLAVRFPVGICFQASCWQNKHETRGNIF